MKQRRPIYNQKQENMATIIKHNTTGKNYYLLGTGFGVFQSSKPHVLLGNLIADVQEGEYAMVCACDGAGKIFWIDAQDVTIVSVDGQNIGDLNLG